MVSRVNFEPEAPCPLDGIRVLDLSRLVAGNMLSLQLADFGAEVIKIESPATGDPLRDWRENGLSLHWKIYGRNKKSVALDLRKPEGLELFKKLAATADVLIENFRPGMLERIGIGPDALHAANPNLIVARISGFGQSGPYRDRPGFGTIVEGMSGFAAKNGFADRPPVLPPMALADMVSGLYGAYSVLIALRHREVGNGPGQVIDIPLLDSVFSVLGADAATFRLTGKLPERTGSRSPVAGPRNVFRTKDGRWISLSAPMQAMAERLFAAIGRPDMILDERFRTNAGRVQNADACDEPIAAFIATRTLQDALSYFEEHAVTAAPVYEIDQFIEDPHVREREIVVELPDDEMGATPMHNIVPRLSDTPGRLRRPAPHLGEHTGEILASIGCSSSELASLAREGIIGVSEKS